MGSLSRQRLARFPSATAHRVIARIGHQFNAAAAPPATFAAALAASSASITSAESGRYLRRTTSRDHG